MQPWHSGCGRSALVGMTAITTGLAGQQQARSAR